LVEAVVSLAVAGLLTASATGQLRHALQVHWETAAEKKQLDAARSLIETAMGSPCSLPPPCPEGLDCSLVRSELAEGLAMFEARVGSDNTAIDKTGAGAAARSSAKATAHGGTKTTVLTVAVAAAPCSG
jgi:hypothetical protein